MKNCKQGGFIPHISKLCGGFTMAELIISMSVFAVMTAVATGAFVQALRSQRSLTDFMAVNSNAGLVLEQIAREMRTGRSFQPVSNLCSEKLNFQDRNNQPVEYRLSGGSLLKNGQPLTAPNVFISKLCFRTTQKNSLDPWRVNILMAVGLRGAADPGTVNVQTTVSARLLPSDL